jgi:hypothetical protein
MKLPNFKDILKTVLEKLSVLKNNVSVMISIILALLAILLFIPTQLLSSGLKKEIQRESLEKNANKISGIQVISEEEMENARKDMDRVIAEANSIALQAVETTKRELLRDDIFNMDPNDPNSSVSRSVFFQFSQDYCGKINQFIKEHNAGLSPTVDEVEKVLDDAGVKDILSSGATANSYDTMSTESKIVTMMIEQVCRSRAESSFIYVDPFQISGYGFWSQYQYSNWVQDVENCWYSQLGYWIIEDIFDTIVELNKDNKSLTSAPVKRLMKIYFTPAYEVQDFTSKTGIVSAQNYTDRPKYVLSTDKIPTETLTGRYCNDNYHVVHFGVKLVMNTKDLSRFSKQLCSAKKHTYTDKTGQTHNYKHNQITILDMTVKSVNMNIEEHNLCWYGDADVSEVGLTCEYLFNKSGYEDVMPQSVKNLFESN